MKIIIAVAAIAVLSGCASTPLPAHKVKTFADHDVAFERCYERGFISGSEAAQGKNYIAKVLSRQSYEPATYNHFREIAVAKLRTTDMFCKQLSATYQSAITEDNRPYQPQQDYQYTPTRTICNNIAGQVMCNSM